MAGIDWAVGSFSVTHLEGPGGPLILLSTTEDANYSTLVFKGGADVDLFTTWSGYLVFDPAKFPTSLVPISSDPTPPYVDFDLPRDANGDNVYEVDLQVIRDDRSTPVRTFSFTITNIPLPEIVDADHPHRITLPDHDTTYAPGSGSWVPFTSHQGEVFAGAASGTPVGISAYTRDSLMGFPTELWQEQIIVEPGASRVTYSLLDDAGGRFQISPAFGGTYNPLVAGPYPQVTYATLQDDIYGKFGGEVGVVTVKDGANIVFDPNGNNIYSVTVLAFDGRESRTKTFDIKVFPSFVGTSGDDFIDGSALGNGLDQSNSIVGILGGLGIDTLSWPNIPSIHIDLGNQLSNAGAADHRRIEGIEIHRLTNGADEFTGPNDANFGVTVYGLDASDMLNGGTGNDTIYAGNGTDTVFGGDGNDTLIGNEDPFASENDYLNGGAGSDTLYAENSDTIQGGPDRDFLYLVNSNPITIDLGATSIEWISSDFGNDIIDGSSQTVGIEVYSDGGNDTITGSAFDDIIWSGSGNDTVTGGDGNDVIVGDIGADSISGGNGNDRLYVDPSDTLIDGGDGFDAAYITSGTGLSIDLAATHLEFVSDEKGGNDTINGAATTANLEIYSAGGNDTLIGGTGSDALWCGSGNDTATGNDGNDALVGGTGADRLTGGAGIDALFGTSGNGGDGAVDTFVFTPNWGIDFVFDFEHGIDKLDMTALGTTFAALTFTDTPDGHCWVNFGLNLISVANNTTATVTAGDFLF